MTKSCPPPPVKAGNVYDRLTVVSGPSGGVGRGRERWSCRCVCGNETLTQADNLRYRARNSCGCGRRDFCRKHFTTHGLTKNGRNDAPEFRIWCDMRRRCRPAKKFRADTANYHARGIRVCRRWSGPLGFRHFLEDIGNRPSGKHSIERLDNHKGYSPENCQWATRKTQNRNRRNNRILTLGGRSRCLSAWAEEVSLKPATLLRRLKLGWPVEKAIRTPVIVR